MNTRSSILRALRSDTDLVSSASLCRELGISRAAISKQVKILRDQGYDIETAPRLGYSFISAPDLLLPDEVLPRCSAKIMGQAQYRHHLTIDSTNTEARNMAESGCPHGTLIAAETQSGGKGRKGRDWASPAECGIYATLVLRPPLAPEDTPLLTLLTAVTTAEAVIEATGITPAIKWPNDILVNGKKVAGILTELSSDMDRVEYVLIGIGINVNTPTKLLPKRPIFPASSLAVESGKRQSRQKLLAKWLEIFELEYRKLLAGNRQQLLDHWKSLSDIIGRRVTIKRINDAPTGTIIDINSDGALLLKTKTGELKKILSGDISYK
jgi:BirA family biotin operon repressor/biotin-[acetyl-CoA-carboxylase] ligase